MHMVHMKTSCTSMAQALTQPDGLAVVAVLFAGDTPAASNGTTDQRDLHAIANNLYKILTFSKSNLLFLISGLLKKISDTTTIVEEPFNFGQLLPPTNRAYYRYMGSLTTPPCSEAVVWTVMMQQQMITDKQVIPSFLFNNPPPPLH